MTSRERVRAVLRGEPVDRVPLNVFAGWNPGVRARVEARYGSVDAFARRHHLDLVTGVLPRFPFGEPGSYAVPDDPATFLAWASVDPDPSVLDTACDAHLNLFLSVRDALAYHAEDKAVAVHAWGVFELSQFLYETNGMPGTEEALLNMVAEQDTMRALYLKLAAWSAACVEHALRAGVDVVELSDDWGQQHTMLFSPKLWRELIYPATQLIVDTARRYDVPVILHSDGDVTMVLDGIRDLGVRGLHPVQESAGMSFARTREILGPDRCLMGGLDTVTALPAMTPDEVRADVRRVFDALKPTGPFIFAGSHMFQDDAPLDVIEAAYETAYERAAF